MFFFLNKAKQNKHHGKMLGERKPYMLLKSQAILLPDVFSVHLGGCGHCSFPGYIHIICFFSMENILEKAMLMPSDPLDRLEENLV